MGHEKCIQDFSLITRMEDLHAEQGILLKWFLTECEDVNLIHLTRDVAQLSDLLHDNQVTLKARNLLISWVTIRFSRITLLC
jgi:hypothetical protein